MREGKEALAKIQKLLRGQALQDGLSEMLCAGLPHALERGSQDRHQMQISMLGMVTEALEKAQGEAQEAEAAAKEGMKTSHEQLEALKATATAASETLAAARTKVSEKKEAVGECKRCIASEEQEYRKADALDRSGKKVMAGIEKRKKQASALLASILEKEQAKEQQGQEEVWRRFTPESGKGGQCMSRVWNGGKGGQCSKSPAEGSDLCALHQKNLNHGRVDGPIPEAKLKEFLSANGEEVKKNEDTADAVKEYLLEADADAVLIAAVPSVLDKGASERTGFDVVVYSTVKELLEKKVANLDTEIEAEAARQEDAHAEALGAFALVDLANERMESARVELKEAETVVASCKEKLAEAETAVKEGGRAYAQCQASVARAEVKSRQCCEAMDLFKVLQAGPDAVEATTDMVIDS